MCMYSEIQLYQEYMSARRTQFNHLLLAGAKGNDSASQQEVPQNKAWSQHL